MEIEGSDFLSRKTATQIKGIAIVIMVIHHCFGFPKWYVNGIDYTYISILGEGLDYWITSSTKICVSLYAFLTGYSYFYNKNKTLKYSIKKIFNLLLNYWFILFIIFMPLAIIIGLYKPTINTIILNMFALKGNLVCFAWYVYFYIFLMLILPFISKKIDNRSLFNILFFIILCIFINNILSYIQIGRQYLIVNLSNCFYYFQIVIIGYMFSKYNLFKWIQKYCGNINKLQSICILLFVLGSKLKWKSLIGINLDIIYVPIMIYTLIDLLDNLRFKNINTLMEFLGKHSLNIWFLHSIFFSYYTKTYFQRLAYVPKNPVLVVAWVIILCIPFSIMINYIVDLIKIMINCLSKNKINI